MENKPENSSNPTGIDALDRLIPDEGITTLRCRNYSTISKLTCQLLARNATMEKNILYFQMLDYHGRYWSFDYDGLLALAKECGTDIPSLQNNVLVIRAFSSDNVESESNWKMIFDNPLPLSLIIVDAINELYEKGQPKHTANRKNILYVIGKINSLCILHRCRAIIFDTSHQEVSPYLAHSSVAVIQIPHAGLWEFCVIKHASQADGTHFASGKRQLKLWNFQR